MNFRRFVVAAAAVVACAAAATSGCVGTSTTGINPPPTDTVCARGALVTGDSLFGLFDAANGCRTVDLFSSETTFANGYSLALTSGKGYLATMGTTDSNIYLRPSLELVTSKKRLIAYDSYYFPQQAALTFVADSTTTFTLRAATVDTLAGDLGFYFIKLQSCKVPAAPVTLPADSVTQAATLTTSDCLMPMGDFNTGDSSRVQLYSMHLDAGQARTIYWRSATPLIVLMGPTYDTFATIPGSVGADSIDTQIGSLDFAPSNAGDYTIVVGTNAYTTAATPYTLTIGAQHASPPPSATQGVRTRAPRYSVFQKSIPPA
jgi:hypothetical protein